MLSLSKHNSIVKCPSSSDRSEQDDIDFHLLKLPAINSFFQKYIMFTLAPKEFKSKA